MKAFHALALSIHRSLAATIFGFITMAASSGWTAEPPVTAEDLPRIPPTKPADAPATIHVKNGFRVELIASEPLISSPVALSFDERGRMFVVQMIDYSERRDQVPHLGSIRLLEDTNGDGIFDKSSVYADDLPWPTGVFCYDGGIFVIANPDILYLKDTKGTGRADVREIVFSGFSEGVTRVNVQEMPNSLIWGLDNRIHGATSGNGGSVRSLRHPEAKRLDLNGHDFSIEPRAMTMSREAGGGQHGLTFDDFGHRFTCNNSDHIRLFIYDERYASRNPFYALPPALESIAVDGPAAEVYRISIEEPWRVVRTRWRIAGVLSGPVEGGGRSSGYFTGATGITIYRGNAFPPEFHGDAFIGECAFNLLHRKKLIADDVGLKARRPPDETNIEFLASKDNWFRPVQCANAPDGALYVMDMYREIVEHPWSLPDSIKKFLDLNSGSERGRIYRIVPDGFAQPAQPHLDKASATELVKLLEHPNGWHRDTAARLLYERQDKSAVPALLRLQASSESAVGRLHALYALLGLNELRQEHVLQSLGDPDEHIREHAVKLSENFLAGGALPEQLWTRLQALINDPSIQVRYQLAFTLGEMRQDGRVAALEQIVSHDVSSPWVQAAVLNSLFEGAAEAFLHLCSVPAFQHLEPGQDFLRQLVRIVGARNDEPEVSRVLAALNQLAEARLSFSLLRNLGEDMQRAGTSLSNGNRQETVQKLLARANISSLDAQLDESTRVEAVRLLGMATYAQGSNSLLRLLASDQPETVQLAAVSTLARFVEPDIPVELAKHWNIFTPNARAAAISAFLARKERIPTLLKAIQSGAIPVSALSIAQIKALRNHRDPDLRQLAVDTLGEEDARPRRQIVDAFQDALRLNGKADHGKAIYLERCSSCHRLAGSGFALGPDLVTTKAGGKEKMLISILDPNREVAPNFIAFEIETWDGESATGIIASESTTAITVRQALGKIDVIPRMEIKRMRSLGQSVMPDGLEQGLNNQDLADLMEFITSAEAEK